MREMTSDPNVGCAVVLLQSMLALIDKGDVREAHPATKRRSLWSGKGRGDRKVPRYERQLFKGISARVFTNSVPPLPTRSDAKDVWRERAFDIPRA